MYLTSTLSYDILLHAEIIANMEFHTSNSAAAEISYVMSSRVLVKGHPIFWCVFLKILISS